MLARWTALLYCSARDTEDLAYAQSFDSVAKIMHCDVTDLPAARLYLPLHCARRLMS